MRSLWRKFRAWRLARRERYAERWSDTHPYDGRGDKYLSPRAPATGPDSMPPPGAGAV